jgi:putative membrane protein
MLAKGGGKVFKLVIALLCALLVAIFAVQNYQTVPIRFLASGLEISLALVIIGSAAVGATFAFVLGIVRQFNQGRKMREYKQKLTKLEQELQKLQEEKMSLTLEKGEKDEQIKTEAGFPPEGELGAV